MTRVLVTEPVPAAVVAGIQAQLPEGVVCRAVSTMSEGEFLEAVETADILFVIHRRVDARILERAPRLRFIQRCGVGYDNIDLSAAAAAGVPVAYTPGANASAVAEHTILLMLALLKQFPAAEEATRAGEWWTLAEIARRGLGDLAGASVGLVGLGNVGEAVARRLVPFGAVVRYTARRRADAARESALGVTSATLPDLLSSSSIVSLHLPLSPDTRGLIGAAELAMMPAGSYLLNTSRGELVDKRALREAILSGHLAGAGLDVLEHESAGGNPFTDLPQVIITPHVAGATRGSTAQIIRMAVANVVRFLTGQPPLHLVSPA